MRNHSQWIVLFCSYSFNNQDAGKEMSLRWQADDNSVSNLTISRFEPQTSRFKDKRVSA